jgi:A/G-specific adenine glycosylase
VVVDANVERVVSRLFAVEEPLPQARERLYALAGSITPHENCGDFAQAMMDLGATICTPRSPDCGICPIASFCEARRQGRQEAFPMKAPKAARPRKQGIAYWLQHEDHVLLVRRPGKGLLGGMMALPTGPWSSSSTPGEGAPADAQWSEAGAVEHVFTHFALSLRVYRADAERRDEGIWWPVASIGQAGLPTVFAKAAARALA